MLLRWVWLYLSSCMWHNSWTGYGSVSPKSMFGRILTVFYAAIGIPLTLCYLATVGDFMSRCIRAVYSKIMVSSLDCLLKGLHVLQLSSFVNGMMANWCPVSVVQRKSGCSVPIPVSLILVFFYLCGGAGVFWWLEGWSFVDAVFFCFASLATIGFGGMLDPHSKHVSYPIT